MSVVTQNGTSAAEERERYAKPGTNGDDPAAARMSRQARRGMSPELLRRVAMLPPRDRAIIELTLGAKLSRSHIGRAFGMAPGQVSRRVRILYARLHDPLVVALFDDRCPLAPEYRQLAIEHFLLAQSAPQLSDKHRITPAAARRMIAFIRGWHKGTMTPRR